MLVLSRRRVYRGTAANEFVLTNGLLGTDLPSDPQCGDRRPGSTRDGRIAVARRQAGSGSRDWRATFRSGGLTGQPNYAFLQREWLDTMQADPAHFVLRDLKWDIQPSDLRGSRCAAAPPSTWPPAGAILRLDFVGPTCAGPADADASRVRRRDIRVSVHYEIYDGIPCYCKWITVTNGTDRPFTSIGSPAKSWR